jgi:protein SCO1/2
LTRVRLVFPAICLVLAAGLGGLVLVGAHGGQTPSPARAAADIGGPFQLVDQFGKPVDQRLLLGKWSAIFFGYTFCPEACPTTLQGLAAVQDRLGDKGRNLQIIFVTVDPARDTSAKMKAYLETRGFPTGVIGLTGTPDQVSRAAKAYRVYYARQGSGPDYAMDHSVVTYLMDPQGRFVSALPFGQTPDETAAQIAKTMAAGA